MIGVLKGAFKRFQSDQMTDHAAALTYYVMMSLFPALLVAVSLLGVLGSERLVVDAVQYAQDNGAPAEVTNALEASLKSIVESSAAGFTLVIGLAVALFGSSGAFGAAGRALNVVFKETESRSFVRHKLSDLAWTIVVIVLGLVALVSVFLGGGIASDLFGTIGLGDTAATIWSYARWLVAIVAVLTIYAIVFAFGPDREPRRLRLITPGALAGVVIWFLASAGFFFYVSNFGSYGATYGAFAGAVILLLWLYISSIAFLFGAEIDAELGRFPVPRDNAAAHAARPARAEPAHPTEAAPAWSSPGGGAGDAHGASGGVNGARVDDKYGRDALAR